MAEKKAEPEVNSGVDAVVREMLRVKRLKPEAISVPASLAVSVPAPTTLTPIPASVSTPVAGSTPEGASNTVSALLPDNVRLPPVRLPARNDAHPPVPRPPAPNPEQSLKGEVSPRASPRRTPPPATLPPRTATPAREVTQQVRVRNATVALTEKFLRGRHEIVWVGLLIANFILIAILAKTSISIFGSDSVPDDLDAGVYQRNESVLVARQSSDSGVTSLDARLPAIEVPTPSVPRFDFEPPFPPIGKKAPPVTEKKRDPRLLPRRATPAGRAPLVPARRSDSEGCPSERWYTDLDTGERECQ